MNCAEAAECVSALFDGEPISREVAAHLSDCPECRVRLNEYAEMSAELRDMGSAATLQAIPEGRRKLAEPAAANNWLSKWRGTMRIPRFAFALMLIAIFALSGGLALVKARTGGGGPVLSLEFKVRPGDRGLVCSTETNREGDVCSFGMSGLPGHIWGSVRFLKREGERVKLSIKTVYHAPATEHKHDGETADAALKNVSPAEYWLEPDNPLRVPVEGLGNILVFGEFSNRGRTALTWFQYEIRGRDGKMIMAGAVPPNGEGNPYYDADAGMSYPDGTVWFHVRMLARIGEAEKIGVRALWHIRGEQYGDKFFETLHNMPERQFLYSPNEDLKIPVENYGNLEIKGQFDSNPETLRRGMYPEYGKFRIDAPVLLVRGKEVLGRFDGGGGELSLDKSYFAYGQQGAGWYLFSAKPIEGAVEGTLTMNDVEFTLDGKQYSFFTGNPIVFGRTRIWVKHYASIKDADPTSPGDGWQGNEPQLAFGELENLAVER